MKNSDRVKRRVIPHILLAIVVLLAIKVFISNSEADANASKISGPDTWAGSPHADAQSESFTHWDDEGEIPENCAACHSESGFLDFIGADGTEPDVVNHPAVTGTVVSCETCHNDKAKTLSEVTFPSGVTLTDVTSSIQCMICHQGRASTVSVEKAVDAIGEDTISADLQFINIHYRAAAATLYGTEVKGGYEYPGLSYVGRFSHVAPFDSCGGCHDAHTTEVKGQGCATCHQNESLFDIRTSTVDYDADADVEEGIAAEIQSLHGALAEHIQRYSQEITMAPVLYDPNKYPYFFSDQDKDGLLSEAEAVYPNRYRHWTPRLLKAAYNYQFVAKDPGAYAHNPRYVLQLLHDSISSLANKLTAKQQYTRPE